ncbi:hypothetical protein DFH05DRAFT_1511129 [Lentinula detonsa]|uniref:DUF6534 domain-containing protein n=1 Tax=Lentinula detonsa TaxID=2804962 RepID=A0A9W8NT22_9AGAR|nr:hypothetical protein DFH05DRAFT_1511129 [Lentinula detonsa]KAJ3980056.1 hypothetical protein F5890DRAFT_1558063 [Lentinula detonsa]
MSSATITTQDVAETLGAVQIGVLFSTFLFGILFMQWVAYFTSKFNDGWTIRGLVYWVMILDITHVAISWEYLWMYTVANFGNPATLYAAHWQYDSGPIFIVLTAAPTQFFLITRTRKMLGRQHPYLANGVFVFACLLGTVQVLMGLYMSGSLLALDASGTATTEGYLKFVPISVAWESVAIATDMTVMISLVATLMYRRTGFKQTDWMLYNLILVAIECALPVTIFTIGHITGVVASPTTAMHQLFAWSQARLYSNTLFLNLNERSKLRRGQDGTSHGSMNVKEVNFLSAMERTGAGRNMSRPQVHIDVTREEHYVMESMSNKGNDNDDFKPAAPV